MQLEMAAELQLPLFLHSRAAAEDFNRSYFKFNEEERNLTWFIAMVKEYQNKLAGGVVHSFTGTVEEMEELLDLGFYIGKKLFSGWNGREEIEVKDTGINGCSMKTAENLAVVKRVPLDRLMLETGWLSLTNNFF